MASRWRNRVKKVWGWLRRGKKASALPKPVSEREKEVDRVVKSAPPIVHDFPYRGAFLKLAGKPGRNPVHVLRSHKKLIELGIKATPGDAEYWRAYYQARIDVLNEDQPMRVRISWFNHEGKPELHARAVRAYKEWVKNLGDAKKLDALNRVFELEQERIRRKMKF